MGDTIDIIRGNPVEEALRNPIILSEIFKNETIEGKNVRLVCKLWNEILLSLPKPKLYLDLFERDEICLDDNPFLDECEPRLGKWIKIDDFDCWTVLVQGTLLRASTIFNDHLTHLDLKIEYDELLPVLYLILRGNNNCKHLSEIRLFHARDHDFSNVKFLGPNVQAISTRSKLISLYLKTIQLSTTDPFCVLGQLLIDSAPNLQRFELSSLHFFPDLSKCFNLTTLRLPRGQELSLIKFDALHKMLKQVAHRLKVFLIGCQDSMSLCEVWDGLGYSLVLDFNFIMPHMPNLINFRNEFVDIFNCGEALEEICGTKCTKLENLIIGSHVCMDDLLIKISERNTSFCFGNDGVRRLSIENIGDPTLLIHLKHGFPFLKKLEIFSWDETLQLGPTFQACSLLELTHLDVTIEDYPEKMSDFVACFLNNKELFKVLKFLTITRTNVKCCLDGRDDLKGNPEGITLLQKFVMVLSGMKRVVIHYPIFQKWTWWDRIQPCMHENNIQLEFKGWPIRDENGKLFSPDDFTFNDFRKMSALDWIGFD